MNSYLFHLWLILLLKLSVSSWGSSRWQPQQNITNLVLIQLTFMNVKKMLKVQPGCPSKHVHAGKPTLLCCVGPKRHIIYIYIKKEISYRKCNYCKMKLQKMLYYTVRNVSLRESEWFTSSVKWKLNWILLIYSANELRSESYQAIFHFLRQTNLFDRIGGEPLWTCLLLEWAAHSQAILTASFGPMCPLFHTGTGDHSELSTLCICPQWLQMGLKGGMLPGMIVTFSV